MGGSERVCCDVWHTGALALCVLPISSRAGQAHGDKMAGWLQALSIKSGEGSSASSLPAKLGAGQFEQSTGRACNKAEADREGAWQTAAGKCPLAIMPTSTWLGNPASPAALSTIPGELTRLHTPMVLLA